MDGPPVSKSWGEGFCGDWKWCAGDIATEPELPADDSGLEARVAVGGLITGIMGVVSWLPLIICDWYGTRIICPGDCTLNGICTSRVVFCTLLPFEVNSSLAVRLGNAPFIAFGTLTAGTDTGEDDVTAASEVAAGIGCTTFIELTSLGSPACDWVEVGVGFADPLMPLVASSGRRRGGWGKRSVYTLLHCREFAKCDISPALASPFSEPLFAERNWVTVAMHSLNPDLNCT